MKRFEILEGLPGDGPLPTYFGFEPHGKYREGFVVRFFPASGGAWVGNFQAGQTNLYHIIDGPSNVLTVIVGAGIRH
jgi:hypothetical protein